MSGRGRIPCTDVSEPNWANATQRRTLQFHHHRRAHRLSPTRTHTHPTKGRQGFLSPTPLPVSLPHKAPAAVVSLPLQPPPVVRCLVAPLSGCADAGSWRHSVLNLLLLMLLLKEAIGTCYFCRFPGSLGLAMKVLIGGVIRRCMVAHGGFVGPGVVGRGSASSAE